MRGFRAWRYRNGVYKTLDLIFYGLGQGRRGVDLILQIAFPGNQRKLIRTFFDDGTSENEAAAIIAVMCLRYIIFATTADQRALSLHALKTGNAADTMANNLTNIIEMIGKCAPRVVYRSAIHETVGALEGRNGEDLDQYRTGKLLEDALSDEASG